jgi:hypothetical protein
MWFSERKINTTIQSKGKCDSNVADVEDKSIIFEPRHGLAGGRLSVSNLKSLQDTLRLLFKGSEFTNALVLPVEDFSLFGKFN